MMLNFVCSFCVHSEITHAVISRQIQLCAEPQETNVNVIGHEKDGTLIYTWDGVWLEQQEGPQRTHISIYNPVTKLNKVVFIHDRRIKIVNCTINQEHTFLGFVTHEVVNGIDPSGKKCKQDLYRAYLAEVAPQNRVFYLNIERTNYLMLQFLYGKYRNQIATRESHMLVFLHRESIGLYHLPISKAGDRVVMSGQPKKEQVFHRKFVWSQWDMHRQCLYVAHFRKLSKSADGRVMTESFLTCYQFTEQAFTEFTLEIPVDLPGVYMKSSNRMQYLSLGPSKCIPDLCVNMSLLSADDGTLCLCYQQPNNTKARGPVSDNGTADLQYTVFIVHHGKKLNCTVSKIPQNIVEEGRLLFTILDDYLLVYLPGQFVHLLNVSIHTEPGYHILYHGDVLTPGRYNVSDRTSAVQYLTPYYSDTPGSCRVFDNSTGKIYDITSNMAVLCRWFETTTMLTTRSAILNYTVATTNDSLLLKQLFQVLCNDICSPEVSQIMEDYLITSVFSDMKKIVDSSVIGLLPCSTVLPFTNQIEKNPNGERLAKISYSNMRRCNFAMKKWHSVSHETIWDRLSKHVQMSASQLLHRFTVVDIQKEIDNPTLDNEINERPRSNSSSLFQKFVDATKSAFSSVSLEKPRESSEAVMSDKMDVVLGTCPLFLERSAGELIRNEPIIIAVQKVVFKHLNGFLTKSSPDRNKQLAEIFATCMFSNSIRLCHLVWGVVRPEDSNIGTQLGFPAADYELDLLHMFERYVLATSSQCFPVPTGFQTFFTALGFRCLKFRMFLQYVDQGIFELTPEFVSHMLEDLNDDDTNEQMKFQIISRLPQQESLDFIQQWENPVCSSFLVQQYIAACLKEDSEYGEILSRSRSQLRHSNRSLNASAAAGGGFSGGVSFPPLATLMKKLHSKDRNLAWGKTKFGDFRVDSQFIEETALRNTSKQTRYSLNNITL